MIQVKDEKVLRELLIASYHPILIELLTWFTIRHGGQVVITSAYRPHDDGVHGTIPCRAVDLRSWAFDFPQTVCDYINRTWTYDPERPEMKCAIFHDVGYGKHIHLQVHPRTVRNKR